jgi:molybdopterin-containing oxidoreductase family membrane subunit
MTPIFAVLGMALSLLHQSSLGATYGVLSGRSIWYKPSLPVMFIVSAVAGGMALTLFATILTSKLRNRTLIPDSTKFQVARVIGYIALGYLYIKLWDWAATSYYSQSPGTADALSRLQATTPYTTTFWWLEIVLGLIIPAVILLYRGFRRSDRLLLLALGLIIMGVVVNRWNVTLSGLIAPPDWSLGTLGNILVAQYIPSTPEIIVSIGILGYGLLAFTLGARYLPIFSRKWAQREESQSETQSPEVQVSPGD